MTDPIGTCSVDVIERLLENKLTAEEQTSLESHLDACDNCCDRLQAMTAKTEQWADVATSLSSARDVLSDEPATNQSGINLDFLQPTDDPYMLGRFAGYEIAGVIGSGGMGIVLKGYDRALNRNVAIKVLMPHYASSAAARSRFAREARAAAAVVHENVIEIYGVSVDAEEDTLPYLVMRYVGGESLQKRLDRCGVLTVAETLRISIQISAGLAAAHEQGLVHRDIKPANVLLPENVERVKITDFGLARAADDASLTRTGVIAGTPQYMSPEQAEGGLVTFKSDLFSLGSVIYVMCTGRVPFRAETPLGLLRKIVDEEARPIQQINPEVPWWLCQLVTRLHAKSPDERYESAAEVTELLTQCLAHLQQPDSVPLPMGLVQPAKPKQKKNVPVRFLSILTGVVMLVVLTLGVISLTYSSLNTSPAPADSTETPVTGMVTQSNQPYTKNFVTAFADAREIGTLYVDIKRGSITVVGHDEEDVIVELEVPNYMPESSNSDGLTELRPNNLDFDITTTGNRIKVDANSQRYITNLLIKVPYKTNLDLDSYRDGKLKVSNVQGHHDVRSFHSNITLTECSGSARLWTYHGDLVASFDSVNAEKTLYFESYNGSIELFLPAEVRLDTQLRTGFGKLLTNFEIVETKDPVKSTLKDDGTKDIKFDKFVRGTINGGGPALRIETEHGDIRINKRLGTNQVQPNRDHLEVQPAGRQGLQNQGLQSPGTALPVAQPVRPFPPLDADHEAYIDQLLAAWQNSTAKINRYRCDFDRRTYDPKNCSWRDPITRDFAAHTTARGRVRFAEPDKGMYEITDQAVFQAPTEPGGKPTYAPIENGREEWRCNGKSIYQYNFPGKQLLELQLPPELQGQGLAKSPVPFLFGAEVANMRERYWLRVVTPDGDQDRFWLEAYPKRAAVAKNYQKLIIILSREPFLPISVNIFAPNYHEKDNPKRSFFEFKNREVNGTLDAITDFFDYFARPETPNGWTRSVKELVPENETGQTQSPVTAEPSR